MEGSSRPFRSPRINRPSPTAHHGEAIKPVLLMLSAAPGQAGDSAS